MRPKTPTASILRGWQIRLLKNNLILQLTSVFFLFRPTSVARHVFYHPSIGTQQTQIWKQITSFKDVIAQKGAILFCILLLKVIVIMDYYIRCLLPGIDQATQLISWILAYARKCVRNRKIGMKIDLKNKILLQGVFFSIWWNGQNLQFQYVTYVRKRARNKITGMKTVKKLNTSIYIFFILRKWPRTAISLHVFDFSDIVVF